MKNLLKMLLSIALLGSLKAGAFEKPEEATVDPSTASLEADVDAAKAQGKLGAAANQARHLETKRLSHRYLQLGLKPNKTAAEQEEFKQIGAELKARLGNAFSSLLHK